MRLERDSLGELMLPDDALYGIGSARLSAAAELSGPGFPPGIIRSVARIRQAQAVAFGRNGSWPGIAAVAIENAAEKLAAGFPEIMRHIVVMPQHGGGARGIVSNVDEIIANLALDETGNPRGAYHKVAPLFQLDQGISHLETYLAAVNISLIEDLAAMTDASEKLLARLRLAEERFGSQGTLARIQFQDVAISNIGREFGQFFDSISRSRKVMYDYRSGLGSCWRGDTSALEVLNSLLGEETAIRPAQRDFPWNVDLHIGFSGQMKHTAIMLHQFCNRMRVLIGVTRELDQTRVRANHAFNPTGREFIIPDTVSQLAFSVIGGDAALVAASMAPGENVLAYIPLLSSHLSDCAKWLTIALRLLDEQFLRGLAGNGEPGRNQIETTSLQAERLIPVLGYDRAVQVARIAALTEKPVRMVVEKMKMLSAAELEKHFPSIKEENEEAEDEKDEAE